MNRLPVTIPIPRLIGMRYIKTALAVTLCVLASRVLKMEYPFYAAIAAVISMENTVYSSFKVGRNRMMGTAVGALVGLLFALIQPNNALLCGLGIIVIIFVCQSQGWKNAISIACIVFLAIMINLDGKSPILYSVNRLEDTLLGIVIALAVNAFVAPYDSRKAIQAHHEKLQQLGARLEMCLSASQESRQAECRQQRNEIHGEMNSELNVLSEQFKLYREEFPLNRDLRLDVVHQLKQWMGYKNDPEVDPEETDAVLTLTKELTDHLRMLDRLESQDNQDNTETCSPNSAVLDYHFEQARKLSECLKKSL